jgi:hypothetical protein
MIPSVGRQMLLPLQELLVMERVKVKLNFLLLADKSASQAQFFHRVPSRESVNILMTFYQAKTAQSRQTMRETLEMTKLFTLQVREIIWTLMESQRQSQEACHRSLPNLAQPDLRQAQPSQRPIAQGKASSQRNPLVLLLALNQSPLHHCLHNLARPRMLLLQMSKLLLVRTKKTSLPNLVASDAARARRVVIVKDHVNAAKMPDSVLISASVKMKAMVEKVVMDDTWVFLLRRMMLKPPQLD